MKYKANTRRRALEYEKDWVQRWKTDRTFEKSVEQRPVDNAYVFYAVGAARGACWVGLCWLDVLYELFGNWYTLPLVSDY